MGAAAERQGPGKGEGDAKLRTKRRAVKNGVYLTGRYLLASCNPKAPYPSQHECLQRYLLLGALMRRTVLFPSSPLPHFLTLASRALALFLCLDCTG